MNSIYEYICYNIQYSIMTNCSVCGETCIRVNAVDRVPYCMKYLDKGYKQVAEANPLCVVCAKVVDSLGYMSLIYPYTVEAKQDHYPSATYIHDGITYELTMHNKVSWSSGYGCGVMAHLELAIIEPVASTKRKRMAKKCGLCKLC